MIPSLAPIFVDGLAPYRDTLVLPGDPRDAIEGRALFAPATLDRMMDHAAEHFGAGDRRALASLWAIDYVHVLMPGVVVAGLLLGRTLPVALDEIALILDDEKMPGAIRLPHDGAVTAPADAFTRFDGLVRGHLEPAFDALAAYSGVSPRVLWTNAANLYEAIVRALEQKPGTPADLIAAADLLVTGRAWPDGGRNHFHRPVFYSDAVPDNPRWRRVCCVRYLIPSYDYCSNCPHLLADLRKGSAPADDTTAHC
ncbi:MULTISPECIES: siderophore-iron reductase FhuF [Rhodomicrobium]|uniref:siderophore-iron reductase FhuF n=1 Tax=Rhodomicrobium TaxID=1068 RepID=UPI000B4BC46E|nr:MULTISPECIES: siderophore-iron reductase FhuF [Rhodomicrobium]